MNQLRVSLEEGFSGDHVVVTVDGITVYDEPAVTTLLQVGLAGTVDAAVADGSAASSPVDVGVDLPERGISGALACDPAATPYVRVSIESGQVALTAVDSPPYYA